jgi:hypothetical protein
MWEVIKTVCGLILFIGMVLAVASTVFIFSWVFKIIGFILAVLVVLVIIGWVIWELLSGWWQERRATKKAPK